VGFASVVPSVPVVASAASAMARAPREARAVVLEGDPVADRVAAVPVVRDPVVVRGVDDQVVVPGADAADGSSVWYVSSRVMTNPRAR
jgi:hypothetical protein